MIIFCVLFIVFPNVTALAEAPEDEVMKCWQGLGYYSRARNLHAAAKSMNGVFPATYEGVRALKGVGDYTAAAICSSAYGMPYAVVDGMSIVCFPAISASIRQWTVRKARNCLLLWQMR